ncbi:uncharacterized protein LOC126783993 [Argentina anserina]|uniref:uncharacterized protein LOC126783993 n=1 Tax=Argentina anserina TaxID=57926 RepID=UPI00217665EF|nr:uncharacterized protein LOC126783993 [Potentilla anserina]
MRTPSTAWVLPNFQAELRKGLALAGSGRTADPAVHAGDFDADPVVTTGEPEAPENDAKEESAEEHIDTQSNRRCRGTEPLSPPRSPCIGSARRKSTGVNQQPLDPAFQQKRSVATIDGANSLEDFSCAGLDGSPWPKDAEKEQTNRKEEQEDEQEYYKHHKASPLSEIEVADTRKPITRATDGTANARGEYGGGRDVIGWKPEQLDTAEETLLRAARIWKENATRGDPDAPQSRVLRLLLRERGDSTTECLIDQL